MIFSFFFWAWMSRLEFNFRNIQNQLTNWDWKSANSFFMRRFHRPRLRFCLRSLLLTKDGETCVLPTWQPFGAQLGVITLLLKEKKRLLNCAKDVWPIPVQSQGKIAVRAWSLILEVLILCCCSSPSLGMPVVSNQTPGDKLLALTFFYDYTENLVS